MPPKQAQQANSPTQNELATLQQQFAMLMTRFEAQQLEIETLQRTSLQPRSTPSTSPAPIEVIKEPAVSKPEPFTGTEDLSIFLQQCELSFDLQPSRFPTDFYRVGFILSYLRGPAARWARPYLSDRDHELRTSLSKFTAAIQEAFGDPTQEFRSTAEIRSLKQTTTVARYSAEFQAIASHLKWNSDALCSQFYEGLADPIKDEISKNPPTTLREYMTIAIRLDNRRLERSQTPLKSNPPTRKPPDTESSSNPPKFWKLDDEERARCIQAGLCFFCREKGHKTADCTKLKEHAELKRAQPATTTVYSVLTPGEPNYAMKTGPRESVVHWRTPDST